MNTTTGSTERVKARECPAADTHWAWDGLPFVWCNDATPHAPHGWGDIYTGGGHCCGTKLLATVARDDERTHDMGSTEHDADPAEGTVSDTTATESEDTSTAANEPEEASTEEPDGESTDSVQE